MRILAVFLFVCASGFAESWYGSLVDAPCYGARGRNVNPTDTETYVNRDVDADIRYCSPTAKTKSFALVEPDNTTLVLDAAGNEKAAQLVQGERHKGRLRVIVDGTIDKNTVHVDSIELKK